MKHKTFDYSKLLGRMKEKGFTQASLSRNLGISEVTLNAKLANRYAFSQDEIIRVCGALEINLANVEPYFFIHKL